jgi:MFS family permease
MSGSQSTGAQVSRETTTNGAVLSTVRQTIFLVSLPFGILAFILPFYGKEVGADAVQIGLFFSAFSLMTVLLRPAVGVGLDRYGRRPFFVAGMIGYGLTMLAFAFSAQVWAIVLARILQGTASACLWLAAQAITSDAAGSSDRARSFGSVEQSGMRGSVLGTFIGAGVLMSAGFVEGWRLLFVGYGMVGLVAALIAFRHLPETNPRSGRIEPSPIVWSRPMALLLLVTAVTGASAAMLAPIMMIFLQEQLSAELEMLALAYLPAALVLAFLPAKLGSLADRFGRKKLMVTGMMVATLSSFLIPNLRSLVALAGLWAVQAISYAAGDPAEQALVADLTGGDQRGRAYGLYALAAGLGATVGPFIGGWLYEVVGPRGPFYANGAVLAVSTFVLWALLQVPDWGTATVV